MCTSIKKFYNVCLFVSFLPILIYFLHFFKHRSQMSQSPAVFAQSPNSQIAPSPAANYQSRTPGAPSPGSALNTPRNYFL